MEAVNSTVATTKQTAIKAYKENKPFIKKYIADELPKVYKVSGYNYIITGAEYIWAGITYIKGEPVDFCGEYKIPYLQFEVENLEPILKQDFKRRGEQGLMQRIQQVKAIHAMQKQNYPHLFETKNI